MAPTTVTTEELHTFHKVDRDLYSRLVNRLGRDPIQSMQVIALWLWLEHIGFPSIIFKIVSVSDDVVSRLADEATVCLKFLGTAITRSVSSLDGNLPATQSFMEGISFSLQLFHEHKLDAISGVSRLVNEVCLRALGDLIQQAASLARQSLASHRNVDFGGSTTRSVLRPVPMSQVMHPLHYGADGSGMGATSASSGAGSSASSSRLNPGAMPFDVSSGTSINEIPANERTMFLTFSRGYPISATEVWDFFSRMQPNSIEEIFMQEVPSGYQSMFARVVMHSSATITTILGGQERAKFAINGKHVWARRYVARQTQA